MKKELQRFGIVLSIVLLVLLVLLMVGFAFAFPLGWSSDLRLTFSPEVSEDPAIAVDSNDNNHIVWHDFRNSAIEIYYTKLDNNGNTLVDDLRITFSIKSAFPSISLDSNDDVHIAWNQYLGGNNFEIYYAKLDNNGNILVNNTRITFNEQASFIPKLKIDSYGNVHVVWSDFRDGPSSEIYYKKLDNQGNVLVDDTRLTFDPTRPSQDQSIAIDRDNNLHVVWDDWRDGNAEIYYKKLDNNGSVLVNDTRLTFANLFSVFPSISIDSQGNLNIVWTDLRDGNHEIYYTKLDNDGNTIVDDKRLTFEVSGSGPVSISTDRRDFSNIVWVDGRDGNTELYYMMIDNNGSIIVGDFRLTFDPEISIDPEIFLDSKENIHLAWTDGRDPGDFNWEIYYKRSIDIPKHMLGIKQANASCFLCP